MGKSSVSVKPYGHSPTSKWVVSYTKDSRRRREFFRTKKEAATRRDQILIELENLGNKAFAISDELRLEAVQCAERLAHHPPQLTKAITGGTRGDLGPNMHLTTKRHNLHQRARGPSYPAV